LNDRYEQKNVYKTDAFMLYLSGLIYEAMGEVNDAFIDYRHAYNTYTQDYEAYYDTPVPTELQAHLLRTASTLGFQDIFREYEQQFPDVIWPTPEEYRNAARLVVIWENGVFPYKIERVFRQYIELNDEEDAGCYLKFAFPAFVSRVQTLVQAEVAVAGTTATLELAQDVAQIAIKNLEDRRLRTMAAAVTRNLIKCAAEYELEKENRLLGLLFGGLTELLEGADTRYWSLLPSHISITQLLLPPGIKDVELRFLNGLGQPVQQARYPQIVLQQGKTTFLIHRTFY
jgi:hypothetical protein